MSANKPRVTFIVSGLTPTLGLERVTLNLIDALQRHLEIRVIAIGGSNADKTLVTHLEILGTPLQGWRRIRSLGRLYSCSRRRDLGTVVLVGVWTAVPWLIVARTVTSKTLVWEHTLLKEKLPHSRPLRILKLLTRLLYKRADHVVAVSEPVAEDLNEYGNIKRVSVIPNVVQAPEPGHIEKALARTTKTTHRILCVGSLTTIKAQHLALESLALLDQQYSLAIVGAGPRMTALVDLAEQLGIRDRVEFTGYVDRASVKRELHKASLLLHCSVAETFGLVYAEAADACLPVVSVDTRVARQMIPSYSPGWLSEATPEALAEAIRDMPKSAPFSTEAFISASRRRALDFGAERVEGDWLRLLDPTSTVDAQTAASKAKEGTP